MYSFKCGVGSKNKVKGSSISQTKHFNFEDYKKCLDGEEYRRESDNYILRSINLEMYLQKVKNLHYPYSMINDIMKIRLKVNLGNENIVIHICYLIIICK